MRPPKGTKELWRMMGEERVNNELILKQYGIIALAGGMLKHKHFEVMRLAIGRHCDSNKKKTFSIYRFINFPLAHFIISWILTLHSRILVQGGRPIQANHRPWYWQTHGRRKRKH